MNLRCKIATLLDARLLGTNVQITHRGPFDLRTSARSGRTRIFRDGALVTNTPDLATAQALIDSYRKIGRI
jgi:hypothetical protein